MKTGEIIKVLGVSRQTLSVWAREFSEYLSEKTGRFYHFTREDFEVLATINELSAKRHTFPEIHERLAEGYRTEAEGYFDLSDMIPIQQALDASKIRAEVESLKLERDRLLQTVDAQADEIKQLQRELGRAEMKAEMLEKMLKNKD